MHKFERESPTEAADAAEIVRGILAVQARFAAEQNRPLGRGTHTKGVCVRFAEMCVAFKLSHSAITYPRGTLTSQDFSKTS